MAVVPPSMRRSENTIHRSFVQDVKRAFFSHLSVPGVSWVELLTWGPEASRRVFPDGLYGALSAGELTSDAGKRLERERRRQSFRVIRGGKTEARQKRSSSPPDLNLTIDELSTPVEGP
jgi:hypothetical protein